MKKSIFLLFIVLKIQAQVFQVGQPFAYYNDIIPDTLINYNCSSHNSTESYFFDINADNTNDIEIKAACLISPGGNALSIKLRCLNINSYSAFSHYDSSWCTYYSMWFKNKVEQSFVVNDTLNSSLIKWESTTHYLTLSSASGGCTQGSVGDWINPNDQFIGIKYNDTTSTIYGWIRVNVPQASECYIKDFSYADVTNGISEFITNELISFYPNPNSGSFVVESAKIDEQLLQIFDMRGKLMLMERLQNKNTNINACHLPPGVYNVCISNNQQKTNKRLVIVK